MILYIVLILSLTVYLIYVSVNYATDGTAGIFYEDITTGMYTSVTIPAGNYDGSSADYIYEATSGCRFSIGDFPFAGCN